MGAIPRILLMLESSRTCERDLLRGIARYARIHGPWTFYHKPKFYLRSDRQTVSISQIKNFKPDGIIVSDAEKLDDILKLAIPTIIHTFKSNSHEFPMVLGDTQLSGRMAAEYLLGLGYKNFAYCGIGDYYWSKGRYCSYQKMIRRSGFETFYYEINPRRIRNTRQKELKSLANWLSSLPLPLGLMTCADDCSQHVIEACRISNIHIPHQISVIGVDNDDMICEFSNPALSSISLDFDTAGYQTAELMDRLVTKGRVEDNVVTVNPTHIQIRTSTDILAIEDPDVAAAVRFIRTHGNRLIQISDVMNQVTCCQRLLHMKFTRILGKTIHQEIKAVRIEAIAKMLRDTDLTISQIAGKLGYTNAKHLSRYFQQQMSITPLAYRKRFNAE